MDMGTGAYLVRSLGDISLEHQGLFDLVQQSLWLVESGRVDTHWSSQLVFVAANGRGSSPSRP